MTELSDLVDAWPESKHGLPGQLIEFRCPSCTTVDAAYWPKTDTVSCPNCRPDQIAAWLADPGRVPRATYDGGGFRSKVEKEKERLWVRDQAATEYAEEKAAEHATEWFGVTGEGFDPDEPEPEPCVLEFAPGRFAFAPGINILFGSRSSLKTWLGYEAIRQEVRLGNRALLIDYEMSYSEAMRRLHVLGASAEDRGRVVYVRPEGPISDEARAQALKRFDGVPPSVVVLDSVGMSMAASGYSTNDDSESSQWSMAVPQWIKNEWPGTVQLLIDHTPKGDASARDPIGSQRKGAFADGLYSVEKLSAISRATRGTGRVTLTKDRQGNGDEGAPLLDYEFGGGGPFVLMPSDPNVVSVDLSKAPDEIAEMRRIARYVADNEGAKVEPAREALGIHAPTFTRLKERLVSCGAIEHRPRLGLFCGRLWQAFMDGDGDGSG